MSSTKKINSRIGVAIAGLGFGEIVHIPALKTNPEFKILSLWHPRKERIEESSKKINIKSHPNWDYILEDKNITAIIIATPPEARFNLAIEALKANKHLLLEKPAALNADEISELQKLAMKNNLSVAVNFEYRAVPLFMEAKSILSKGLTGTPWLIRLDWLMSSRADPNREWNWYSQEEKGGGVIGALGTHAFDIIQWLLGPIVSVSSLISTSIKERPNKSSSKISSVSSEDIALAQLEIKELTGNKIFPAQVSLSSVSREGRGFLLEIYGSEGTLILSSSNQKDYVHGFSLWFAPAGEKLKPITPNEKFIFPTTWSDGRIAPVSRIQGWWAKTIRNGEPMIPGLAEGLASQKIADTIKASSKTNQKMII